MSPTATPTAPPAPKGRHALEPAPAETRAPRPAMLRRLSYALSALLGAALLSQFPAFYDQYLQRLGGRLDQARIETARIAEAARQENLSLGAYIEVFLRDGKSPVRRQGRVMQAQYAELVRLETDFAALREAPALARPLRFAGHAAGDIAGRTFEDFRPALPLGAEGLSYALAGLLAGLAGAGAGGRALSAVARRRRPA